MFEFIFGKSRDKKTLGAKRSPRGTKSEGGPYQAVRIHTRKDSCGKARSLAGQAFLCSQAPMIPLPECKKNVSCRCVYEHIPDRRTDARRDSDVGLMGQRVDVDRRGRRDRRKKEGVSQ